MLAWLLFLAQIQASPSEARPKRPVEIQALVDRARRCGRSSARTHRCPTGCEPGALQIHEPGQQAASNDIEALTRQMRAVEAMLTLDPQRALALFDSATPPEPANVSCKEILTPNVALYYEVAAKLFARSFTPKQRKKGDDLHFLKQCIAGMRSPVQAAPTLRLIHSAKVSDAQKNALTAAYAVALDGISGSDRVFAQSEGEYIFWRSQRSNQSRCSMRSKG